MTKTNELPLSITEALTKYYFHFEHQHIDGWDKGADLKLIDTVCKNEGWGWQSCAGTFWFSKRLPDGKHVIEISHATFPDGGKSNVLADGEPFGALAEITAALRKSGKEPLFIDAGKI